MCSYPLFPNLNTHLIPFVRSGENQAGASSTVLDRFHSAIPTAASSFVNISEYDRKLSEFDQKRAPIRNPNNRIVTWADPISMRQLGRTESSSDGYGTETTWGEQSEMPMDGGESWARRRLFSSQLQRQGETLRTGMSVPLTPCS